MDQCLCTKDFVIILNAPENTKRDNKNKFPATGAAITWHCTFAHTGNCLRGMGSEPYLNDLYGDNPQPAKVYIVIFIFRLSPWFAWHFYALISSKNCALDGQGREWILGAIWWTSRRTNECALCLTLHTGNVLFCYSPHIARWPNAAVTSATPDPWCHGYMWWGWEHNEYWCRARLLGLQPGQGHECCRSSCLAPLSCSN